MRTIVFVCHHGAVKSVIAAALLEREAEARRLCVRAIARGTEPDAELPASVLAGLAERGVAVRLDVAQPRRPTGEELGRAAHVVSFGPELGVDEEHWDDVPAMADAGFAATYEAIAARVPRLLARLDR